MTQPRFHVYKNGTGQIGLYDREQATSVSGSGLIALFFKGKGRPDSTEIIAGICAKALNEDSDRRKKAATT